MGLSKVRVVASGMHAGSAYSTPVTHWWPTDLAWVRNARRLPDSVLYYRRRRTAHIELRSLRPRSILFICHGNICRSPFAAAAFVRACPPGLRHSVTVKSAGFIGPGRASPSQALAAASRCGIDMSTHRSALVTEENLQAADLVVVMSADQARDIRARVARDSQTVLVLGDVDPSVEDGRTIADPWGGPDSLFDASYRRIVRCVAQLVTLLLATEHTRKAV